MYICGILIFILMFWKPLPPAHLPPKEQNRTSSIWHRKNTEGSGYSSAHGKPRQQIQRAGIPILLCNQEEFF